MLFLLGLILLFFIPRPRFSIHFINGSILTIIFSPHVSGTSTLDIPVPSLASLSPPTASTLSSRIDFPSTTQFELIAEPSRSQIPFNSGEGPTKAEIGFVNRTGYDGSKGGNNTCSVSTSFDLFPARVLSICKLADKASSGYDQLPFQFPSRPTQVDKSIENVTEASYSLQNNTVTDAILLDDQQHTRDARSPLSLAQPENSNKSTVDEVESDSPLDNVRFMSFEEWKRHNLERAGQNPNAVNRQTRTPGQSRRSNGGRKDQFDSFGEEGEIDLGFSGFEGREEGVVSEAQVLPEKTRKQDAEGVAQTNEIARGGQKSPGRLHRVEAGTTSKSRFNYASDDCAATVMKTNPEARSSSAVLIEYKDSYMLNECGAPNKFFIVELCDDILVDTIVLANLEFFSSIFRSFRVSVSDRYPVRSDRWKVLGTFEARNAREIQAFPIANPLIWARYLRVEFLSHYGNEFYCPITLLRVHGTTMMEEFRYQEAISQGEDDGEDEAEVESETPLADAKPDGSLKELIDQSTIVPTVSSAVAGPNTGNVHSEKSEVLKTEKLPNRTGAHLPPPQKEGFTKLPSLSSETSGDSSYSHNLATSQEPASQDVGLSENPVGERYVSKLPLPGAGTREDSISSAASSPQDESDSSRLSGIGLNPDFKHASPPASSDLNANSGQGPSSQAAPQTKHQAQPHSQQNSHANLRPNPASAASPIPTTQESFFKSIHKRLLTLEENSTLSLQYMDAQSAMLKEAFAHVERRQLARTDRFLDQVNTTVVADLRALRLQYDLLWETTVSHLNAYRDRHAHDMLALSTRMSLVADELVFQKRLAVLQATLLLTCLGLVIFVRISGASVLGPGARTGSGSRPVGSRPHSAGAGKPPVNAAASRVRRDGSTGGRDPNRNAAAEKLPVRFGVRHTARNFFHSIISPSASPMRSPVRAHPTTGRQSEMAFSPALLGSSPALSPAISPSASPLTGSLSPSPPPSNLRYYHTRNESGSSMESAEGNGGDVIVNDSGSKIREDAGGLGLNDAKELGEHSGVTDVGSIVMSPEEASISLSRSLSSSSSSFSSASRSSLSSMAESERSVTPTGTPPVGEFNLGFLGPDDLEADGGGRGDENRVPSGPRSQSRQLYRNRYRNHHRQRRPHQQQSYESTPSGGPLELDQIPEELALGEPVAPTLHASSFLQQGLPSEEEARERRKDRDDGGANEGELLPSPLPSLVFSTLKTEQESMAQEGENTEETRGKEGAGKDWAGHDAGVSMPSPASILGHDLDEMTEEEGRR